MIGMFLIAMLVVGPTIYGIESTVDFPEKTQVAEVTVVPAE